MTQTDVNIHRFEVLHVLAQITIEMCCYHRELDKKGECNNMIGPMQAS